MTEVSREVCPITDEVCEQPCSQAGIWLDKSGAETVMAKGLLIELEPFGRDNARYPMVYLCQAALTRPDIIKTVSNASLEGSRSEESIRDQLGQVVEMTDYLALREVTDTLAQPTEDDAK